MYGPVGDIHGHADALVRLLHGFDIKLVAKAAFPEEP
jgi:hypothetical protein